MKVLVIGGGGREHAICWKLSKSPKVDELYFRPGNAGIAEVAKCVDIGVMDFEKMADFAKKEAFDLVVVGPDDPLAGGIVDVLEEKGLRVFGPRKNAAILEGSKAFSKDLMKKYNIPTAAYETFTDPHKALEYLQTAKMPIVLKADGLALGKGVLICNTLEEALAGVDEIMLDKKFSEKAELEFKAYLESIGDSIVCVADDDVVKIHVHTNDPGLAIQKALTFGQLSRMKIDNMREEHQEKLIKDAEKVAAQQAENKKKEPRKPVGFITVSIGDGMNDIFKELGVDYIIEGGQTMNPSTEDMLTAIDHVNADHIFILPNNKNIILAANQAQSLTEDKDIIVIPTKTVPQGITAIINYMPEADVDTNIDAMNEGIKAVKTGQVTYAVRDTRIDDKEIHEGDIMGIGDAGILAYQRVQQDVF